MRSFVSLFVHVYVCVCVSGRHNVGRYSQSDIDSILAQIKPDEDGKRTIVCMQKIYYARRQKVLDDDNKEVDAGHRSFSEVDLFRVIFYVMCIHD